MMKLEIIFVLIIFHNIIKLSSGAEDNSMSTLPTGNSTFSVTTWGYPWPPQMHWLDHHMNLSSLLPIELDGLILGDRLKTEINNHSHVVLGWVVTFILNGDILDAYYYKHYASNTESMVICQPAVSKLPVKIISRNYALFCWNYTPGSMDIILRLGEWEYTWTTYKYPMSAMFTLAAAVFIAGSFGNLLIIRSIIGYQDMRSTTNYFLASLAVADLCVTSVLPPKTVLNAYFIHYFRMTIHGCRFIAYFEKWMFLSSMFHLTAVSFERYFAICHPMKVKTICTTKRAKLVIAIISIVALICAAPELPIQREERPGSGYYCLANTDVYVDRNYYTAHRTAEFVLFCILPFGLILHNYIRVARSLHLSLRDLTELSSQYQNEDITKRTKVVEMLVAIIIIFFLCWTPRLLFYFLASLPRVVSITIGEMYEMRTWLELVSYINSCVNAYIYYLSSDQFKNAFRKALTCSRSSRESYQSTGSRGAPARSYVRHQKQEQPSNNDSSVAVVSSENHGNPIKKL